MIDFGIKAQLFLFEYRVYLATDAVNKNPNPQTLAEWKEARELLKRKDADDG